MSILGVELTPAEAVPYQAGLRLAQSDPAFYRTWDMTAGQLTPYLRPNERIALSRSDDEWFTAWVHIGILAAQLLRAVHVVKGT